MKAAGISIVATYVFWIHHEEIEGEWDWSDNRTLRDMAGLCAKHDLYFFPRIGPWSHGECRNGGFSDWLLEKCPVLREDRPVYLAYVEKFYRQIYRQIEGYLFKDGGPIIGVQLENEISEKHWPQCRPFSQPSCHKALPMQIPFVTSSGSRKTAASCLSTTISVTSR